MDKKEIHPWEEFLKARYKAMLWMRDEQCYSAGRIAYMLSMDEHQVISIFMAMEKENDK